MVECPYCGEEISHLVRLARTEEYERMDAEGNYTKMIGKGCTEYYYLCPKCGEVIAEEEDDAIAFLNGKESANMITEKVNTGKVSE